MLMSLPGASIGKDGEFRPPHTRIGMIVIIVDAVTEPVDPNLPAQPDPAPAPPPVQPPQPYQQPHQQPYQPPYQPPYQQPYQPPQTEAPGTLGYTPSQPYPAQQYPGQQYPAQQYPGQQYPGQPYPGQPYPPQAYPGGPPVIFETPPPRRRRWLIPAAVAVVVAVAAVVVSVVATSGGSSSTKDSALNLPAALGSYLELPGGTADQFRSTIGQAYGAGGQLGKFFANASMATYSDTNSPPPQLILIAAPAGSFPGLDASSIANSGGSLGAKSYPAGKRGGTVECFTLSFGAVGEDICFWSDKKTLGYLVSVNSNESATQIAEFVNEARDVMES